MDWQLPPSPELRRVLAVARDLGLHHGVRVILSSVELWSSSVTVHVSMIPEPDLTGETFWELADDLGTVYRFDGSGIAYDGECQRYDLVFHPGVPDEARWLRLRVPAVGASTFDVDVVFDEVVDVAVEKDS